MANYTINIPTADVPRVLNGFKIRYNYNVNKKNLAVPTSADPEPDPIWETEIQFAKRKLNEFIFNTVIEGERPGAVTSAVANIKAEVEALNITVS